MKTNHINQKNHQTIANIHTPTDSSKSNNTHNNHNHNNNHKNKNNKKNNQNANGSNYKKDGARVHDSINNNNNKNNNNNSNNDNNDDNKPRIIITQSPSVDAAKAPNNYDNDKEMVGNHTPTMELTPTHSTDVSKDGNESDIERTTHKSDNHNNNMKPNSPKTVHLNRSGSMPRSPSVGRNDSMGGRSRSLSRQNSVKFRMQQRQQVYRNGVIGVGSTLSTIASYLVYAAIRVDNLIFLLWIDPFINGLLMLAVFSFGNWIYEGLCVKSCFCCRKLDCCNLDTCLDTVEHAGESLKRMHSHRSHTHESHTGSHETSH